jgi:predicted nucleic acid-binding protein
MRRYGLMVNDSLIVTSMQEEGIGSLATSGTAFSKVEEISVYSPGGVKLS